MRDDGTGLFGDRPVWPYVTGLVIVTLGVGMWVGSKMSRDSWGDRETTNDGTQTVFQDDFEWIGGTPTVNFATDSDVDHEYFYALSTAPGTRWEMFPEGDVPEALYRSVDGQSWESMAFRDGFRPSSFSVHDSTVYLVATAPGTRENSVVVQIDRTEDGGENWSTDEHEIGLAEGPVSSFISSRAEVATGPVGVLIYGGIWTQVDNYSLVPGELLSGNRGVEETAAGIRVVDFAAMAMAEAACSAPCDVYQEPGVVVFEKTWEELGFDPDGFRSNKLFFSKDGSSYIESESPVERVIAIASLDDGFVILGSEGEVWRTFDGLSWEKSEVLPISWITSIGSFDGGVLAVGDTRVDAGSTIVVWSPDGLTGWEEVDLSVFGIGQSQRVWFSAVSIESGKMAGIYGAQDSMGNFSGSPCNLLIGTSRADWSATSLAGLLGSDGWVNDMMISSERVAMKATNPQGESYRAIQYSALIS